MTLFIIVVAVSLAGIGFVAWLIISDKSSDESIVKKVDPSEISKELKAKLIIAKDENSNNEQLINIPKKPETIATSGITVPEATALSGLKDFDKIKEKNTRLMSSRIFGQRPAGGSASLTTSPIGAGIVSSELDQKYNKVDQMLNEKTKELDRIKSALDNEVRNRGEFDKVKSLLEGEITALRNNNKDLQNEVKSNNLALEDYRKKIALLEEKATRLEKELAQKEGSKEQGGIVPHLDKTET
ncbi:MAG: hypothetical protein HQL27_02070 [Candidatus Omnitrophica bacterium]|nr:hypothetical protein [Candidatus Omnitrophota bacterium]